MSRGVYTRPEKDEQKIIRTDFFKLMNTGPVLIAGSSPRLTFLQVTA